jgi:hypothetical protein
MADRSTGPVKPPVIDLTARTTARSESEARPSGDAAPGINHRNDRPPRFRIPFDSANWPLLAGTAVGGAILGTLLTYLLASLLPLPVRQPQMPPDLTAFVNTQGEQITTLSDHISAALPNETGPAMKLPLILSGLESAFATGRPFQTELSALLGVVPDAAIPAPLASAAATGLSRPDSVTQAFEAALPEILAARDHGSADWTQNAVDWAKSLLALRPAEEQQGDSPDAVVSRLEGAMTRHDYTTAVALLDQLPAPMQQAAAPVATDIAAHAAADKLVADLRARALSAAEAKS